MEIVRFETHDIALGLEALEAGFGIDQLLVECRSGEEWVMPGSSSPNQVSANGFFWCKQRLSFLLSSTLSSQAHSIFSLLFHLQMIPVRST